MNGPPPPSQINVNPPADPLSPCHALRSGELTPHEPGWGLWHNSWIADPPGPSATHERFAGGDSKFTLAATRMSSSGPAVTFTRLRVREPDELWQVRDAAGRVDLTFAPTVPGEVRVNALVVESRYRGPFGTLRGRIEPEGLPAIDVDDWFVMGEEFWLRC